MRDKTINIVMDDRERSEGIVRSFEGMDNVVFQVRRLPLGDYRVNDRLLFERKTLPDFAVSVVNGRFFRQVNRLASSAWKGVLILEGSSRDLQDTGIRREALQGALITASMLYGIPVLRSLDPKETAHLMVYAAHQAENYISGGLQRSGYRPKGKRKRQLYILQGFPGIGPARAERLLDHFGSVKNVVNASEEELLFIDGIGSNTAQNIHRTIKEPIVPYGKATGWPFIL